MARKNVVGGVWRETSVTVVVSTEITDSKILS